MLGYVNDPARVAALAIVYVLACQASLRFAYQKARRIIIASILLSVAVSAAAGDRLLSAMELFTVVFFAVGAAEAVARYREVRTWRDRPHTALVLRPPVAGAWTIVSGGPFAHRNHHTTIPGERFAYDLVHAEDDSFGQVIVAPVTGIVEDVRDGMDDGLMVNRGRDERGFERRYGNFVSLRVADTRVMLCHLRRGSVRVTPGQAVSAGEPVGDCGNSGRSFGPHLHIHAQDRPARARGDAVPIAFAEHGVPAVPGPGDRVGIPPT